MKPASVNPKNVFLWVAMLSIVFYHTTLSHGQQRKLKQESGPKLEMTATIMDSSYCSSSLLRLSLKLSFQNTGTRPILLRRDGFRVGRYTVSRSLDEFRGAKYQMDVAPMMNSVGILRYKLEGKPETLQSRLVVLEPGNTHTATTEIRIPVTADERRRSQDALAVGDHLLQIVVWTWLDSESFATRSKEMLKDQGYLWTQSIHSTPIPFKVSKERVISPC